MATATNGSTAQALLSGVPGGLVIYHLKKDGRVTAEFFSEGLAQLYRFDSLEELNRTARELGDVMCFVAPEDIPLVREKVQESLATDCAISMGVHIRAKTGPNVYTQLNATPMPSALGPEDVAVWYAVQTPATQPAQASEPPHHWIDAVPSGIGVFEVQGSDVTLEYMNEAFYTLLGTARQAGSGRPDTSILHAVHEQDVPKIKALIARLMAGEQFGCVNHRLRAGDGRWVWLRLEAAVVQRGDQYLKVYASFADYNEVVKAQQHLERSESTLQIALEAAKVMVWRYNYKTRTITDSSTLGKTYRLPAVIENVPQCFIEQGVIPPENADALLAWHDRQGEEKTLACDTLVRAAAPRGLQWFHVIYTPTFDDNGQYLDSIGIAIDITEQKQREQNYKDRLRLQQIAARDALARISLNLTQRTITDFECNDPAYAQNPARTDVDELLYYTTWATADPADLSKFDAVRNASALLDSYRAGYRHMDVRCQRSQDGRWVQIDYDLVKNPYSGDIEAICAIHDVTESVRSDLIVRKLISVDYQAILTVNIELDRVVPYKFNPDDGILENLLVLQEQYGGATAALAAYLRQYADPGTAEQSILQNSPEVIGAELAKAPNYECAYTLIIHGEKRRYRIIYTYLEQDHRTLLCAVQNTTAMYQQELRQKAELRAAVARAQEASKAKTAFLSRVSHDMRTPLNGILGLTTLLKEHVRDDTALQDLSELEMSGRYLLNLINDTLDMSRIESGRMELHPTVCDGKTLFKNAMALSNASLTAKRIQFNVRAIDLPFTTLYVDVERLEQVVLNVLGNAIKFTPEGGRIDVTMRNLSRDEQVIVDELVVQDSGIGISPEFLPHIFDAFSQEDATRTSSYQGTGLGMSITKQLLELMGGSIRVESELGKGTTCTIVLRLTVATPEQVREWKKSLVAQQEHTLLYGKRVLLCEDHPLNAQIATRLLIARGLSVEHAENGAAGVAMFQNAAPGYYDAVLMDIRMPVMDGLDATRAIRALPRADATTIPIIAMTANAFANDADQTRAAGMNAHLSKPIQTELLFQTLAQLLHGEVPAAEPQHRAKVLIVDDVEVNRAVIRTSLGADFEILEANSGEQALELLENTRDICLMITDIQMPGMGGEMLIRRIRANPKYARLVIIANTQHGDPGQEEALLALGANDFVYKPTAPKILALRVRSALKNST